MLCPKLGPLPQTSQLAATVHSFMCDAALASIVPARPVGRAEDS